VELRRVIYDEIYFKAAFYPVLVASTNLNSLRQIEGEENSTQTGIYPALFVPH